MTDETRPDREALRAQIALAAAEALDKAQGHRYGDDWVAEYSHEAYVVADAVLALIPAPQSAGGTETLREAAGAISALIDAAVRDFRRVYPEPHMLAANLALAVQAQNVLRALLAAAPAPMQEDS